MSQKADEMMMEVLSSFGQNGEPVSMLIVYTDDNDTVHALSNCGRAEAVGLCEFVRATAWDAWAKTSWKDPGDDK